MPLQKADGTTHNDSEFIISYIPCNVKCYLQKLNNIFPIIHLIFLACHSLLLNVSNDHFRTIWFCWLKVIIETTWGDSDMMSLHRGHFPNVYFNFCIFLNKWNLFVFLSNVNVCRGNLHRCLTFFNLSLLHHTDTINENFGRIKTSII